MSQTGTVKSWRRVYGFAEMKDGTLVYIHQSEIDDGKLRVGRSVSFDTEKVEGHDGRLKGVNVSGEAVLKKGEKLSDEDQEADKKVLSEMRDAKKEEDKKALEPVIEAVDKLGKAAKMTLLKKLAKDLDLADKVTLKKTAKKEEEKRCDPTTSSKQTYTKAEFLKFYGKKNGDRMWTLAAAKVAKKAKKAKKAAKKN